MHTTNVHVDRDQSREQVPDGLLERLRAEARVETMGPVRPGEVARVRDCLDRRDPWPDQPKVLARIADRMLDAPDSPQALTPSDAPDSPQALTPSDAPDSPQALTASDAPDSPVAPHAHEAPDMPTAPGISDVSSS